MQLEMTEASNAVEETFREMARVVEIEDIVPHPNADRMELSIVGGWQVCTQIGEVKKGDKAIYFEIDSLLSLENPLFTYLADRKEQKLKVVDGVTYALIKTVKLRKEISQGLIIPLPKEFKNVPVGTNLTQQLGVLKYEKEFKAQSDSIPRIDTWFGRLASWIFGPDINNLLPWPKFLIKSEEKRVQNLGTRYKKAFLDKEEFEETFKLDGASMTVFLYRKDNLNEVEKLLDSNLVSGVCSRNYEISQEDIVFTKTQVIRRWIGRLMMGNRRMFKLKKFYIPEFQTRISSDKDQFLGYAKRNYLMEKLKDHYKVTGEILTIQGELIGPGISNNFEGVENVDFYVYGMFRNGNQQLLPAEAKEKCAVLGLKYIPVNNDSVTLPGTIKELLAKADGPRALAKGGYREGFVYKSLTSDFSFKVVSNNYLSKQE